MSTLFEIVKNHRSLDEIMLEQGGDITDEQQDLIVAGWMTELSTDLNKKADNYQYKMAALESASEALRERAKAIAAAAKVLENMQDNLKSRMKMAMQELDLQEINGNEFKFKLTNSKPSVLVSNANLIPAKFTREKITIEIDKDSIKKEIEAGNKVDGCELQINQTLRVTINKNMKGIE